MPFASIGGKREVEGEESGPRRETWGVVEEDGVRTDERGGPSSESSALSSFARLHRAKERAVNSQFRVLDCSLESSCDRFRRSRQVPCALRSLRSYIPFIQRVLP